MSSDSNTADNGIEHSGAAAIVPDWGHYAPSALVARLRHAASQQGNGYWGKRLAFALRKFALLQVNGPLDVVVFDHRMRIEPFVNLAEKRVLFTPQYFDRVERDYLKRVLPRDGIFVDVGANAGAYSFFAASCMGPTARILAIEPQPSIFERLVANIGFNPGVPIESVPLAVADTDGPIQLFLDANNAGETSMRNVASHSMGSGTVEVQGKPLADLLSERSVQRIDAMKIDIEGAEDLALVPFFRDAPDTLWPTLLIMENSPESWQTDCVELVKGLGYSMVAETNLNVVLMRA